MTITQQVQPQADRDRDLVEQARSVPHATAASRSTGAGLPAAVHDWLARYSITLLRISMGAVLLGFGVLKYFPGVSPAQNMVLAVSHLLTFGLMPDHVTLVLLATVECGLGLSLITGWGLRVTIYVLAALVLGMLSPVVLLTGRLFSGAYHAPTLEGQYVLKDVLLLTATMVIATTIRHGRTTEKDGGRPLPITATTARPSPGQTFMALGRPADASSSPAAPSFVSASRRSPAAPVELPSRRASSHARK